MYKRLNWGFGRRFSVLLMIVLLLVGSLLPGIGVYGASYTPLEEVKTILDSYYIKPLSQEVKSARTIEELINRLGDPYTVYMTEKEYEEYINAIDLEIVGIGIRGEQSEEGVSVVSIFEGSGAQAAGLKIGDVIVEADGYSLKGLDIEQAVTRIRGEEGTSVFLRIKRGNEFFYLRVLRTLVKTPTVESQWLDGNIGYIRIHSFGTETGTEFGRIIKAMEPRKPMGYILDLRCNGGGFVQSALRIAGYFIGNEIGLRVSGKSGEIRYKAIPADVRITSPTLILLDNKSASASEILAGALEDYYKASLVGDTTYGKGTMQELFLLNTGGILKVTTDYTYTPKGRDINKGLLPQLKITEGDRVHEAALLLLRGDAYSKGSKEGMVRITMNEQPYAIVLEQARQYAFWEAYREVITEALSKGLEMMIGTKTGWGPLKHGNGLGNWYFPDYKEFPLLNNIPRDKVFNVDFSQPVYPSALEGKVALIDAVTGERIACSKIEAVTDTRLAAYPDKLLELGREYYFVLDEDIKVASGMEIAQGVLCRAKVRQ